MGIKVLRCMMTLNVVILQEIFYTRYLDTVCDGYLCDNALLFE